MTPHRIQLTRTKGWRMPENTVRVTRRGEWGNPFVVGGHFKRGGGGVPVLGMSFLWMQAADGYQDSTYTTIKDSAESVNWYRWYVGTFGALQLQALKDHLRGKNLACWCKIGEPCHADVLLELSNKE